MHYSRIITNQIIKPEFNSKCIRITDIFKYVCMQYVYSWDMLGPDMHPCLSCLVKFNMMKIGVSSFRVLIFHIALPVAWVPKKL